MNNFSGSGVTNSLLAIIAVLLLVIIIQNASYRPMPGFPAMNPHASAPMQDNIPGHNHPPMDGGSGMNEEFSPSAMIYAALKCPGDSTLTLADPGCQGSDAAQRKKVVDDSFNQGLPIPKIFDAVIQKFGEKALTEQALDIRRSRRG